jgi:hypothetical protein
LASSRSTVFRTPARVVRARTSTSPAGSLVGDIEILLATLPAVLSGRGAH